MGQFYMTAPTASQITIEQATAAAAIYYGATADGGPQNFGVTTDPAVAAYFNDLSLVVSSDSAYNTGPMQINVNNLGWVPVLRSDGAQLAANDFMQGRPTLMIYRNGNFFLGALAPSQVVTSQIPVTGVIDYWVRTDGNDANDGGDNTPARAFQTIAGCWGAVAGRYGSSPTLRVNIRLGIPGDYLGAQVGPFGGILGVVGDANNKTAYRILSYKYATEGIQCLNYYGCNQSHTEGVTLVLRTPDVVESAVCLEVGTGLHHIQDMGFAFEVQSGSRNVSTFIRVVNGAYIGCGPNIDCNGNGFASNTGIEIWHGAFVGQSPGAPPSNWTWRNCNFSIGPQAAGHKATLNSYVILGGMTYSNSNCFGPTYMVTTNAIFQAVGVSLPGSQGGVQGSGGQFYP